VSASPLRHPSAVSHAGAAGMMVLATALWAVSLIAPLVLKTYSPVEITLSRFFFYGAASACILLTRYRANPLGRLRWCRAAFYGLAGNLVVSVLVSFAVQDTGAEIVIPIIGFLPICVSVAGSRALPLATWRRLIAPFGLFAIGLCIVLFVQSSAGSHEAHFSWRGVAAASATVLIWTWYALSNERFLRQNPSVSGAHWSCAIGLMTLLVSLLVAIVTVMLSGSGLVTFHSRMSDGTLPVFLVVTLTLGLGTSLLATSLFNYASHSLPMGLVGQLLIMETVFGIAYACVYHQALPPLSQTVGTLLVLSGIWLSARILLR
jgi:drug/metabolite transporter (DMT)-like permease